MLSLITLRNFRQARRGAGWVWVLAVLGTCSPTIACWSQSARAFAPGEMLRYEVRYAFATGAMIEFRTRDTVLHGVAGLHHRIDGKTRGLIHRLYPVHDVYWSVADRETDMGIVAVRQVQEQKYRDYKVDRFLRHLRSDSLVLVRETGDSLVLPRETQDVVSLFYYLRNRLSGLRLRAGARLELPLYFNAEFYPLVIRYEGVDEVKTAFGRVPCYRFKPLVRKGDLFEDQEALTVWISRDANHVPVRVRFDLFLGSMYCDLVGYRGLAHPFYAQR